MCYFSVRHSPLINKGLDWATVERNLQDVHCSRTQMKRLNTTAPSTLPRARYTPLHSLRLYSIIYLVLGHTGVSTL